jgi:alpha-beta hydrolase superfamily lysophospholipase
MVEHRETSFRGAGGLELYAQVWQPSGRIRGVVAVVHGAGEHSGRYSTLVNALTAHGYALTSFDHRGHGKSPGLRGHIDAWSDYRTDVREFLRFTSTEFKGARLFLYGHSLGALIVSEFVLFHPEGLDGLILSAHPLVPTGAAKPHLILLARLLSRVIPGFSISLHLDAGALSRDPAVVRGYRSDPLVHSKVTARWGTEALAAVDRVRARAREISLPVLVLHGGSDAIDSPDGSRELLGLMSSSDKQLNVYDGGFHEPHNDLQRDAVAADLISWLDAHASAANVESHSA